MPLTPEEFEAQYKALFLPIQHFFRNRGLDEDRARRLAQDTFVEAFKNLRTYRGEASPRSWIFAIAKNVWKNHWRDQKRLKRAAETVPYEEEGQDEPGTAPTPSHPQPPNPLDDTLQAEEREAVREAIDTLPPEQQEAIVLQMDQELQYSEIAAVLKIPVDLVRSRLYQARQKLEEALSPLFDSNGY